MNGIRIREFRYPEDYAAAVRLWETSGAGVHVGPSDAPEEIQKKLGRDPDLFLVAELHHKIIGTVIGGFDGRRGLIYHLAVSQELRRRGVATTLMAEAERRLKQKGCLKAYLLVRPDNDQALDFYERTGWDISDNYLLAKEFN